jgi:hypothetical protein
MTFSAGTPSITRGSHACGLLSAPAIGYRLGACLPSPMWTAADPMDTCSG